ncbi:MAG: carboxypeptidase-like regulatory domain-containing protein [Planctomycetota bacterium]
MTRADGAEEEEPSGLRDVTGRVVDAGTGLPIAGAWVAWRPPPPELVDAILRDPELARDPVLRRTRVITDAEGGFRIARLPGDAEVTHILHAVALDHAYGRAAARLEAVTIALEAGGELEVLVAPGPPRPRDEPPRLRVERGRIERGGEALELPPWGLERASYRLSHLRAGDYRLRMDGGPWVAARVEAGRTTRIALPRPVLLEVSGTLTEGGRALGDAALVAVGAEDPERRWALSTDADGRLQGWLPAGRYGVAWLDGQSERCVPGAFVLGAGAAPWELDLAEAPPILELELRRRGAIEPRAWGLVSLEPGGSLIHLVPSQGSAEGCWRAACPPGVYGLWEDTTWWGVVEVPATPGARAERLERSVEPARVTLRWSLPPELEGRELVRGTLSLLPREQWARTDLGARFAAAGRSFRAGRAAPTLEVPLGAPGIYRLLLSTELGRVRREVELRPGTELVLPLAE